MNQELYYREMIKHMQDGYALHKMIYNEMGKPIDYEYIDVNNQFLSLINLKNEKDVIGKRVKEIIKNIEKDPFDWVGFYESVIKEKKTKKVEIYSKVLKKIFEIITYSPKDKHFVTIVKDISNQISIKGMIDRFEDKNFEELSFNLLSEEIARFTEASLVTFNRYDIEKNVINIFASAGNRTYIKYADRIIGKRVTNINWVFDKHIEKALEVNKTVVFDSLSEMCVSGLKEKIASLLDHTFKIGKILIIKINKGDCFFGTIALVLPKGKEIKHVVALEALIEKIEENIDKISLGKSVMSREEKLEVMLKSINNIFCQYNEDKGIVRANSNFVSLVLEESFEGREISFKEFEEYFHKEDRHYLLYENLNKQKMRLVIKEEIHYVQVSKNSITEDNEKIWLYTICDIDKIVKKSVEFEKRIKNLNLIIDNLPDVIFVHDKDGRSLLCNNTAIKKLGVDRNRLSNTRCYRTLYDLEPCEPCYVMLAIKSKKKQESEKYIPFLKTWFKITNMPVLNEEEEVIFVITSMQEISKEKLIVGKQTQKEKEFWQFFHTFNEMVMVLDDEGRIHEVNQFTVKTLGYTKDKFKKQYLNRFIKYSNLKIFSNLLKELKKSNYVDGTISFLDYTNHTRKFDVQIWKGPWNGEEVVFLAGKDQTKAIESISKFERIFSRNPALVGISSMPEKIFTDVNEAFLKTLGYTRDEVIGQSSSTLNLFVDREKQKQVAVNLSLHGHIDQVYLRVRKKSGEILDGIFSGEIIEENGKKSFLTIMIDVTEQMNAIKLREKANRMQSMFISNISHEIRTPLNSLNGFSSLLKRTDLNKEQFSYLSYMQNASTQLLQIVEEILEVASLEKEDINMKYRKFDLAGLVKECENHFKSIVDEKGIYFHTLIANDVTPIINYDRDRLLQLINLIVDNAIKFTDEGGCLLEIVKRDDKIAFIVKDTGSGIEREKISDIFEPFYQVEKTKNREHGGCGLGLYICKQLAYAMKAEINVESTIGVGSVFELLIKNETGIEVKNIKSKKVMYVSKDNVNISLIKRTCSEKSEITLYVKNTLHEALMAIMHEYGGHSDYDFILVDEESMQDKAIKLCDIIDRLPLKKKVPVYRVRDEESLLKILKFEKQILEK